MNTRNEPTPEFLIPEGKKKRQGARKTCSMK
jgi:hypothetical protein